MDGIFDKILPKLPAWMIVPIAIFWLFLLAWPVLKEIWFSVIPSYRAYTREQRRLELLKLYYEIEAIKKEHALGDLSQIPQVLTKATSIDLAIQKHHSPEAQLPPSPPLSPRAAFGFGAAGGGMIFVLSIVAVDAVTITEATSIALIAVGIRAALLAIIGGFTSWLARPKTPLDAFLRGTLAPAILSMLISGVAVHSGSSPPHA
jgi:hypothetical protein